MQARELKERGRYQVADGTVHTVVSIFGRGRNRKVQLSPPLELPDRKGARRQYPFIKVRDFAELVQKEVP